MKKKFIAAFLTLAMMPMAVYAAGEWYEPYAREAEQLGVKLDGDTVSNEQFMDAALNMLGDNYGDINSIQYAKDIGYITENEMNEPDEAVTRQTVARVISRALQLPDCDESLADSITDWEDTCPYCKPYILKCYGSGIMTGYEDGCFRGRYAASGNEVIAVLVNAYHYRKDKQ